MTRSVDTRTQKPRKRRADTVYMAAQAHSRRVMVMKWLLPVAAAAGLVWMAGGFIISRSLPEDISATVETTVIEDGMLVMANPEVTGMTSDKRPYRLVAQRAIQPVGGNGAITMEDVVADFELSGGQQAQLSAPEGDFNRSTKKLALRGESVFTTDDGIRMGFQDANIDVERGQFVTRKPVRIIQDGTTIRAGRMRIEDNGDVVIFQVNVRLTIAPDALPANVSRVTDMDDTDQSDAADTQ